MRSNKNFKERQFKNTLAEIENVKGKKAVKVHYVEPNMDAELCTDLKNELLSSAWKKFKTYDYDARLLTEFLLKNFKLKKCKKSEATALLFIGQYVKDTPGTYKQGVKHFWLQNVL